MTAEERRAILEMEPEALRNMERRALLGVALASLDKEAEARESILAEKGVPELHDALLDLAALTDANKRVSHRVFALDLLAKVSHRQGYGRLKPTEVDLYVFADAAVREGERIPRSDTDSSADTLEDETDLPRLVALQGPVSSQPPEDDSVDAAVPEDLSDDGRVNTTVRALQSAQYVAPEVHPWRTFAVAAKDSLLLTPEEVNRPLCTDEQRVVMPNGASAVRTAVWMWSDKPASDFARWTDPRTWALDCGLFFKSVDLKSGQNVSANDVEFSATFKETVCIDSIRTLSTDLVFSRSVQAPDLYALEFDLPPPPLPGTAEILVDAGQVTVRQDPNSLASRRTALVAEKFILFKDPEFETWPTVACDLFWTEFAIMMALGCSDHQ